MEDRMKCRLLLPSLLTLSAFWLTACADDAPTEPTSTAQPSATVPELAVASNSWITRANMPSDWTYLAAATVTNAGGQSIVYAIGGENPFWRNPQQTVSAYNTATNTWTVRQPLPWRLSRTNGAGVINGKIYISGGCTDRQCSFPTEALFMYNPATNTWTRKHDIPVAPPTEPYGDDRWALGDGVTGVIGGKLYVVSGCFLPDPPHGYFENCNPLFYRYNPATDQWVRLPSPFAEATHGPTIGGVIDGKFYVMAGSPYTHDAYFSVYDPATNRWTSRNPLGLSRPGAASVVLGGKLYVIGGTRYNAAREAMDTLDITIVYDPATNLWTRRASMPSPRTGIAATKVFLNGQPRIEVIGGYHPGNNLQYIP
jgi:N-acetylneuraminic acid mutarotase